MNIVRTSNGAVLPRASVAGAAAGWAENEGANRPSSLAARGRPTALVGTANARGAKIGGRDGPAASSIGRKRRPSTTASAGPAAKQLKRSNEDMAQKEENKSNTAGDTMDMDTDAEDADATNKMAACTNQSLDSEIDVAGAQIDNVLATRNITQFSMTSLDHLRCPVSKKLFVEPALMKDGQTYEHEEIEKIIASTPKHLRIKSPVTGEVMARDGRPNTQILGIIQDLYDNKQLGDEGNDWYQRKEINSTKKRALVGDLDKMYELGFWYEFGMNGLDVNFATAYSWYQKGADLLHRNCLTRAGLLLKSGQGVAKNEAQSINNISFAANKGHGHAMYLLGRWNHHGTCGLSVNNVIAKEWLSMIVCNKHDEGTFDKARYMPKVERMLEKIKHAN